MTNYNGNILPNAPTDIIDVSRGLFYADALFETIRVFSGQIPFMDLHMQRLLAGLSAMGYAVPKHWDTGFLTKEILKVSTENARVRLTVFRQNGGKYFPENNQPNYIIFSESFTHPKFSLLDCNLWINVSRKIVLACDAFSNFKTLNAARYVAAAIEAKENGWDDVILPNQFGRVAEATSSNVFMLKNKRLYTPSLTEGCVAGTMRQTILSLAEKSGLAIVEKPITFAALQNADEIFLTNAIRGIMPVGTFQGKTFTDFKTKRLFDALNLLV